MDKDLFKRIEQANLELVYLPSDLGVHEKASILHTPEGKKDILLISSEVTEEEIYQAVNHELGHSLYDDEVCGDYAKNTVARSKMEKNANDFMIQEMVSRYVLLGNDVETTNYINLAYQIGTENFNKVKKELLKHFNSNGKNMMA